MISLPVAATVYLVAWLAWFILAFNDTTPAALWRSWRARRATKRVLSKAVQSVLAPDGLPAIRMVCGWCGAHKSGPKDSLIISHGICEACAAREMKGTFADLARMMEKMEARDGKALHPSHPSRKPHPSQVRHSSFVIPPPEAPNV